MPHTTRRPRTSQSIEAQFALAERVLRSLDQRLEAQLERKRDLEVDHALALYKAGKATLEDGDEIIRQARNRLG